MDYVLVILVGLCFGSFVTMASYRLPLEKSIVTPGSFCTLCKHGLRALDLVPVFSWLFSGGKCRKCQAKVSVRYPLIELICASLFLLAYELYGLTAQATIIALFGATLLTMIISDLETQLIPDEIHLFLIPLGVGYHWLVGTLMADIVGCVALAGGVGLLLHYGYYWLRGIHGLGFGDVKFLFVVGVWLASLTLLSAFIFYSGLLGILTGILWKFISKDPRFPFGPALAISLFLLVVWPDLTQPFWDMLTRMLA